MYSNVRGLSIEMISFIRYENGEDTSTFKLFQVGVYNGPGFQSVGLKTEFCF